MYTKFFKYTLTVVVTLVGFSLSWTHPSHMTIYNFCLVSPSGSVMAVQLTTCLDGSLRTTAELIVGWQPSTLIITNFSVSLHDTRPPALLTHIARYLHLSLSHLHGKGQEGRWLVWRREVRALKEFITLKCQLCNLRLFKEGRKADKMK